MPVTSDIFPTALVIEPTFRPCITEYISQKKKNNNNKKNKKENNKLQLY